MAEDKQPVTLDELVYSEMIQTEALTRLLINKGIVTNEELLEMVRTIDLEQHARRGGSAGES